MLGVCVAALSIASAPADAGGSPLASAGKRPALHPDAPTPEYVIEPVGAWGGPVNAFEKHGDIGYVGSGQRLVVLDMSDLTDIRELGSVRLGSTVNDFEVRDGLAYVVTGTLESSSHPGAGPRASGLHVVDVADPTVPELIYSNDQTKLLPRLTDVQEIDLYGNLAFIRDAGNKMWCADLTDPRHPVVIDDDEGVFFRTPGGTSVRLNDLVIQGDLAFAATREALGQMRIYDLSTHTPGVFPVEPQLVGSVNFFANREVRKITVDDGWAYALVTDNFVPCPGCEPLYDAIWAVDVSNPAAPVKHDNFAEFHPDWNPNTSGAFRPVYDIAASGGRLYAADGALIPTPGIWDESLGLAIFDIATDPGQPVLIGAHRTHGSVRGVVADGTTAYLMDLGEGLIAADAANPAGVTQLGRYHSPAELGQMERDGDLLYVADTWNGFSVLDVSDLARPVLVGVYQTAERLGIGIKGLDLLDGVVYLSAGRDGVEAVGVSDPSDPSLVGAIRFPSEDWAALGIVADNLSGATSRAVYLSVNVPPNWYVFSIDASDPTTLSQLDPSPPSNYEINKFVRYAPGRFYAASQYDPPLTLNGSTPTNLQIQTLSGGSPWTTSIAYRALDGLLCVTGREEQSDTDRRLFVLDMHNNPDGFRVGSAVMTTAGDITPHPLGLAALDGSRLQIFDLTIPATPTVIASAPLASRVRNNITLANRVLATGSQEILVTNQEQGGLETLRVGRTADRNADGVVDVFDLRDFISRWHQEDRSSDMNADGRIDGSDLDAFLRMLTQVQPRVPSRRSQ